MEQDLSISSQLVHLLLRMYLRKEFKMLNNFIEYVKQNWQNRPATATPITAERLEHIENGIKSNSNALEEMKRTFLDAVYPVGSIYMSVSLANPSEIFGGGYLGAYKRSVSFGCR